MSAFSRSHDYHYHDNPMYENERIKREFFEYLKGAKGFAGNSVTEFADGIGQWQKFTDNASFGDFGKSKALAFREWLATRATKAKAGKLAPATQYAYMRRVRKFFDWLAEQPGYKGKVLKGDVEFLRLSANDTRMAIAGSTRAKPTFDEAKQIIEGITGGSEIDRRDRAVISFALITGCRISAMVSLKMKNFDKRRQVVDQNPGDGVRTKMRKKILTPLFPIGWEEPKRHFLEWYEYLERKGFGPNDPIFPATDKGFAPASYSKERVGQLSWSGTNGARTIFEKRCKNAGVPYYHPHSFRHLLVALMSEIPLTERQKRAISQALGHENVGTTFGAYGYGKMNDDEAADVVAKIRVLPESGADTLGLSPEEQAILVKVLGKLGHG